MADEEIIKADDEVIKRKREAYQMWLGNLIRLQNELKAPKNQYNSFGKYKYRSCEDILEGVKPLLAKYGFLLKLSDEIVAVGARYYVKATAVITGDGGFSEAVTAYAREEDSKKGMDGSQVTGTASSYARKYALNGLFLIDDTKDADTDAYKSSQTAKRTTRAPQKPKQEPTVPFKAPKPAPEVKPTTTAGIIDERQCSLMRKTFAEFRGERSNADAIADIRNSVGFIPSDDLNQEQYELVMNFMLAR